MKYIKKKLDNLLIVLSIVLFIAFITLIFHDEISAYFGIRREYFQILLPVATAIFLLYMYIQLRSTSRSIQLKYNNTLLKKNNNLNNLNAKLEKLNKDLKYQLYIDNLTNLHNRKALERDIRVMREPKLMLLDIDSFKDINEYYGNETGNFILRAVADILKDLSNQENMNLYRIGADEFALLEDEELDIDRYEELALIISDIFRSKMLDDPDSQDKIEINATLGFALEKENILEKASLALKEAKQKQIDYQCYFQKIDKKKEYISQIKWSKFIKNAIENDRVMPFYQPIFNAKKEIIKYECLVRILDEKEEVFPPGVFLEISKKVKRYADIEKLLIEKSFAKIKETGVTVSVNLLARDMSDSDVSNFVISMLKKYEVSKQVIFEILEDENIAQIDRTESFIQRLKRMGCKIAIDDFGTGYSNFSYLMKLHPDYLKIDGSLIKHIDKDKNSYAIVNSIIAFARKLDIKTIAEFVHSEEVFEICRDMGIDEFQGFYLGEPSPRIK